jgi:hypothetical protein
VLSERSLGEGYTDIKNHSLTTAESKANRKRNNSMRLEKASEGKGEDKVGTNSRMHTNI